MKVGVGFGQFGKYEIGVFGYFDDKLGTRGTETYRLHLIIKDRYLMNCGVTFHQLYPEYRVFKAHKYIVKVTIERGEGVLLGLKETLVDLFKPIKRNPKVREVNVVQNCEHLGCITVESGRVRIVG